MASSNGGSSVGPRLYYQQPYNSRAFKQDYSLTSDRSNTRLQVPSSPRASPMRQTTGGGIEWPSYRPSSGNRSTDSYVGILNSPALNGSSLDSSRLLAPSNYYSITRGRSHTPGRFETGSQSSYFSQPTSARSFVR